MGELTPCIRIFVIVCNAFFIVLALAMIASGIILIVGNKYIDELVDDTLQDVRASVRSNYDQDTASRITADEIDLDELFFPLIVILLVFGSLLFLVCIAGLVGAIFKIQIILILYSTVIVVLAIGEIVYLALLVGKPDALKKGWRSKMKDFLEEYQGMNGTNTESVYWNYGMQRFSCCGVDDYTDFDNSQWVLTDHHLTPWACCIDLPNNSTEADNCAGASNTAAISTIVGKNNYNKGCLEEVYSDLILDNAVYIVLCAVFVVIFQVLLVIFSCVIAQGDSGKTHPDEAKNPKTLQVPPAW